VEWARDLYRAPEEIPGAPDVSLSYADPADGATTLLGVIDYDLKRVT
jgi:hypothetical protein